MGKRRIRLGVNIDHVATLRNARGGAHPDPVDACRLALGFGADGITAHLREDRRHIRDEDLDRIGAFCLSQGAPLNLELAAVPAMLEIALRIRPHAACLVPERREERTTEGGLDVAGRLEIITDITRQLKANGSRVSHFIEASPDQIAASAKAGADIIELHTGAYAHALDRGDKAAADIILEALRQGARQAASLGLEVHAGHGLTYNNVGAIASIPEIVELNIGHFLIGEAVFVGLGEAIREMRKRIKKGQKL